jgi:hypothetical protein
MRHQLPNKLPLQAYLQRLADFLRLQGEAPRVAAFEDVGALGEVLAFDGSFARIDLLLEELSLLLVITTPFK